MSETRRMPDRPLEILMASSGDELYPHFEVWLDDDLLLEVYAEERMDQPN